MPPNNQQLPNQPPAQPPAQPQVSPNQPPPPPPQQTPPPEYQSASQQKSKGNRQKLYFILTIVFGVLFLIATGFGIWAFLERNEYKDETEAIVASEVEEAVAENTAQLEAEFEEREKEPYDVYTSPAAFGAVRVEYPKTWSAYIKETGSGNDPIEGYFHPNFVPDESGDSMIALSLQITERDYDRELNAFNSAARRGDVTITPIEAENVDGALGSRVDGEIERGVQGSVVLFELRDKTVILTTQSTEFIDDFDDIILANLEFSP